MAKKQEENKGLDLSDLQGDVSSPLIFPDSHFGLSSDVWKSGQRVADMLPIDVVVSGDLADEVVLQMTEKAKGASLQAKNWTEYSAQVIRHLKDWEKVKRKQAEVAENIAEARVTHAEIEAELAKNLANLESRYRQIVGNNRSAIASIQDDLSINLNKIASQYSQNRISREQKENSDAKKEETAFAKQQSSLADKFRKAREDRYKGGAFGVTQRMVINS